MKVCWDEPEGGFTENSYDGALQGGALMLVSSLRVEGIFFFVGIYVYACGLLKKKNI